MAADMIIMQVYSSIVSRTYILLIILIIAKIFMWMSGSGMFGGGGSSGSGDKDSGKKGKDSDDETKKRKGNEPNSVLGFNGEHKGDKINLYWAANNEDEAINYYWIERRRHAKVKKNLKGIKRAMADVFSLGIYEALPINKNLWGNWRRLAYVSKAYSPEEPFIDNESYSRQPGIVKEWLKSLDAIREDYDYEYRIRAVNAYGKGNWSELRVSRPSRGEIGHWIPVIYGMTLDSTTGTVKAEGHVTESHEPRE
jgi:hypothetical protein